MDLSSCFYQWIIMTQAIYPTFILRWSLLCPKQSSRIPENNILSARRRTSGGHTVGPPKKCPVARRRSADDVDWLRTRDVSRKILFSQRTSCSHSSATCPPAVSQILECHSHPQFSATSLPETLTINQSQQVWHELSRVALNLCGVSHCFLLGIACNWG